MRVLPVLFAALALPALAVAQDPQTVSTRLNPPPRVGEFRLAQHGPLQGGSGGQLQYRTPAGASVIANLHPVPVIADCARACDSVVVDMVAATLLANPAQLAGGALADSVKVEHDVAVLAPYAREAAYGRHLAVSWPDGGKRRRTELLLYGLGAYLVEVRASSAPGQKADSVPVRFAREFIRLLGEPSAQAQACPAGPADSENIKVGVKTTLSAGELRARIAAVLAGLGVELDPGVKERDVWRSKPHRAWPTGIDYGPWARLASPGFVIGVQLQEKDGAAHATVSAQALCAPEAPDGEARTLELSLELLTAKAVAAKIEDRRPEL